MEKIKLSDEQILEKVNNHMEQMEPDTMEQMIADILEDIEKNDTEGVLKNATRLEKLVLLVSGIYKCGVIAGHILYGENMGDSMKGEVKAI